MKATQAKLIKADSAEADNQTLRAEIAALRNHCEAIKRMLLSGVKQIEQMDERAARLEVRLAGSGVK